MDRQKERQDPVRTTRLHSNVDNDDGSVVMNVCHQVLTTSS